MPRARNPRPVSVAITASTDGRWHGFVPIGTKPDGNPDRVHRTAVMCASCRITPDTSCVCYRRCEAKVRQVQDQLAAGVIQPKGTPPGAAAFLTTWIKGRIDAGEVSYGTGKSYDMVVRVYLVPRVRGLRIDQLNNVDRIKAILADIKRTVSAQAARKTLRVLRVALGAAEAKWLHRNEARIVGMPTVDKVIDEVVPLSREEALAILPVIAKRRNRARWLLGLVHGPRQGECLGLAWHRKDDPRIPSDVDLVAGTITKREKIERRTWQHGCADPHACGGAPRPKRPDGHHKIKPCRQPCNRHTRPCPAPCPKDCIKHASACPDRWGGGLVKGKPKAKASNHTVVLESVVLQAFVEHQALQEAERTAAGRQWRDTGLVFTDALGRAIDPKRDWDEWQSILDEAGLPPARVHVLRHSAATFLLAAEVDKRIVMQMMGWSQDMTATYQHVARAMQVDAVRKLGGFLWQSDPAGPNRPEPDPVKPDSATPVLPDDHSNVLPFRRRAV